MKNLTRLFAPFEHELGTGTAASPPLAVQVYNADGASFHVNAVLVSGQTDAVLLDTGFTRADALRIAAMVLDSKKTLKLIYISHSDPDYYFGIETLTRFFPDAKVVATPATIKKIQASSKTKMQIWGPRLGDNAPKSVPLPEALDGNTIPLEDQVLEIHGLDNTLPTRSFVWIPSIKTIAGGVNIFAGVHVWTADTQTAQERADWMKKLDGMVALQPLTVIPGHSLPGENQDASQITYTKTYLTRFEDELSKAPDSASLIEAMKVAYPKAGLGIALDIGAKVNKGEMKW
ncbi:MAG: MBL fold metallo-hydrolase [Luteolibacter sp.]